MYLRYTLFSCNRDEVIGIHPIGLNISFIENAASILYLEASTLLDFNQFIETLKRKSSITYPQFKTHGEKAKIVFYPPNMSKTSYSTSYSDRVEISAIKSLTSIEKYAHNKELFSCLIFDVNSCNWYSRRYTQKVESEFLIESPRKQLILF